MVTFFLKLIVETLKPYRYRGLTQRSILKAFIFFFYISFVYVILMGCVNAPKYYTNYKEMGTNWSSINKFNIKIDVETNEPVIISKSPLIVIDTSDNLSSISKEDVLIGKETINSRIMFWTKKINYTEYDILSNLNNLKRNTILLILLFIPTILFIAYLITLIKYFIIILIFFFMLGILVIVRRARITLLEVLKSAMYSITIYYLTNIISSILGVRYIGIIVYAIFFITILFLMREDTSILSSKIGD